MERTLIQKARMKILLTGASGFIGKNLMVHLSELKDINVSTFSFTDEKQSLEASVKNVDWVIHLAGVNRPETESDFEEGNVTPVEMLCSALRDHNPMAGVILASSIQAGQDNAYGKSKLSAEMVLEKHYRETGSSTKIYRLPNVFGKWCRPNYNSVVATFCHNVCRDIPIEIHDADAELNLVYVDDVIGNFLSALELNEKRFEFVDITPIYNITVGEVAKKIQYYKTSRTASAIEKVGIGFERALYSTYISYLDPEQFSYGLDSHVDERGEFSEILKTKDSGQISYFSAKPGVTRGGHYHHTKTEKFVVVSGEARFSFRQVVTNETHSIEVSSNSLQVVETIPGWAHSITNIGSTDLHVLLWANEVFNPEEPDTITAKI